jgi:hypothetical protein
MWTLAKFIISLAVFLGAIELALAAEHVTNP